MADSERPKLAIRGQAPALGRATQTEKLTAGTESPVKARLPDPSVSRRGKVNPKAVRPGLHAPTGPQPFISKGRIKNPSAPLPDKLSSEERQQHATSSANSFGVSFTEMGDKNEGGYESQLAFNKAEFGGSVKGKSFLTTTAIELMQENEHSSGNERELLAQGHRHKADSAMMQHTIVKRGNKFEVTSRKWDAELEKQSGGWGEAGAKRSFDSFDDAFERMYQRGVHGVTHFEED